MTTTTESLQDRVDRLREGEMLKLDPPRREFKGPVVIRKAAVIEGQGGTIWAPAGPVVRIECAGVVLRNLTIEITSRDTPAEGEGGCALVIQPSLAVTLDNVAVRGNVQGLGDEEGVWRCPRSLPLGSLRAAIAHEFRVQLVTPVACALESEIDGFAVTPRDLPGGPATVTLRLDPLPHGTRLRGQLLLRTRQLTRRIEVTGHLSNGGASGNGQFLWRPEGAPAEDEATLETSDLLLEPIGGGSRPVSDPGPVPPTERLTEPTRPSAPGGEALVVSAFDTGQYRTIGEALRQARTGARVLVRPGVYKESLTIDKKVEIVGDGPAAEVVVESADGNCLLMRADLARVRGLTLRGAAARGGRERYAVHVPHGQLILEDCAISSDSLACVAATGAGASAVLRRCRVQGGASAGVLVCDKAEALLEDCDVSEHALCGVESRRGGHPSLRGCRVYSCGQAGVLVHDNGKATLDDCNVHGHALAGVEVRQGGHGVLRRCQVHHGRGPGVRVHDGAAAVLEDSDLYDNARANLEVRHGGNPVLRRCRLRQGQQAGALFARDAQGTLEDCDLDGNARAAVEIRQNANPTLRRCKVRAGGDVGVAVRDGGRGTLEDCDLGEAALAVVEVRQSAAPVLRRCKIHDGRRAGVLAAGRGGGTLEECEVFANRGPGVAIAGDSNPALKRCQVHDNGQAGVVAWDNGRGVLERCEVWGNGLAGLAVLAGAAPTARACKITRNRDAGVWACRGADGVVEDCDLTGNHDGSLELESGAGVHLGQNRLDP